MVIPAKNWVCFLLHCLVHIHCRDGPDEWSEEEAEAFFEVYISEEQVLAERSGLEAVQSQHWVSAMELALAEVPKRGLRLLKVWVPKRNRIYL